MAKTRHKKYDVPDYGTPPVIEVVFGIKFEPLKEWMVPHIGAYWQTVRRDFPRCEHAAPIGEPEFIDPGTSLPLPRIWLINNQDDRLIQLQPGRFLFNWRGRPNAGSYPRYAALSKVFFERFREFRDFVSTHKLGDVNLLECELTYFNHIFEEPGWTFPEHLGRVMKQFSWIDEACRFLPRPSTISWQARFPFPGGDGGLLVKLTPARSQKEQKQLLVLELSARGLPLEAPIERVQRWFSQAHEWIVFGFSDLTTDKAQKELWARHG